MKLALVLLLCPVVWGMEPQQDPTSLSLDQATNEFFQKLYPKVIDSSASEVLSPLSIHCLLSMTSQGARKQTAEQMKEVLRLSNVTEKQPNVAYRQLIQSLESVQDVLVLLATGLFVSPQADIESSFQKMATKDYNGTVQQIDLQAPGGPEQEINDWVSQMTDGHIQDILQPGSIDSFTRLIGINALLFNGEWETQFDANLTQPQAFRALNGSNIEVDMMRDQRRLPYKKDDENKVEVIGLKFKDPRFSLYIALPQESSSLPELESLIEQEPDKVQEILTGLQDTQLQIQIPKFKIESEFDLKDPLESMGMIDAFREGAANFNGISKKESLHIKDVAHKAVIEVMETGTVAAAASVVSINTLSLPPEFIADRPFAFFLRDDQTQQNLFQGRFAA